MSTASPMQPVDPARLPELRERVRAHVPHYPLPWLRGANRQALRDWACEDIFRSGPNHECLVFEHGAPGDSWLLVATLLRWDSEWLGRRIARLDLAMPLAEPFERPHDPPGEAVAALCEALRRRGVEYLFAMVPARHVALVKALGSARFSLLETRLTYHHDRLREFVPARRSPVRHATPADVERLAEISADTVNHFDRFHAEEYFDPAAVDRVMREWIDASVNKGFADAVLVPDIAGKPPGAFLTMAYHRARWPALGLSPAQMVLAAVEKSSTGWLPRLINESMLHLREAGASAAYATTQATNTVMVRTLESIGFRFGECTLTFRRVLGEAGA